MLFLSKLNGLFLLLACTAVLAFCKFPGHKEPTNSQVSNIKNKPDISMPMLPAGSGDYKDEWAVIDSLEREGLFKTALEHADALHTRAKNDNNAGQSVKTLIYIGKYAVSLEEDGMVKAIQRFETEAKTARQPEKSVIQSMLGELYNTYLQNQGWQLSSRTPVPNGEGGDILTWSAAQMEQHALDLYRSSVQESATLRATPVDYIRDVTIPGSGDTVVQPLRPTLFDFLAFRALDHFSNDRSYLNEPAYKFDLDQEAAFAPAEQFIKAKFESKDSSSGKWLAIKLFQDILSAQIAGGKNHTGGVIDADLARLNFARNNSVLEDKEARYEQALEILHKQYYDHPSDAEIVWQLANLHYNQEAPKVGAKTNRRQAVTECEDAIRRHPGTYGAQKCTQLLKQIKLPTLSLQTESMAVPDKPVLFQVGYQNLTQIWVKTVQIPATFDWDINIEYERKLEYLNSLKSLQSHNWTVQDPGDYYQHTTELKLDAAAVGRYMLMVSNNSDFDSKKGYVSWSDFYVTNLAAVHYQEDKRNSFVVVDRQTGAPRAGVKADFYENRYDYAQGKYLHQKLGSATSDQNGMVSREGSERENGEVWLTQQKDSIPAGSYYRNSYYDRASRPIMEFFTDRSIYRPGQTVYFKGILYKRDQKQIPEIIANEKVTVQFFDVNGQEKGSLKLKTNEFGTLNGAFAAPMGGLTGRMRIQADGMQGAAWINVEEYKRPKFEVVMKPVEGAYRVNEQVKVTGTATAFAGSSIDGAAVKYRVVRQARFPFWDYGWYRKFMPWNTNEMEITNGTATTGADGSFTVEFTAIPDRSIPKKDQPVFDYAVYVDVTDINGETRSGTQRLSAGYTALQIDLGIGQDAALDSLKHVELTATNMSGQAQNAQGEISLQRLQEPSVFYINRYWEKPDVWTISESNFKKDFPFYAWKEDDDPEKWAKSGAPTTVAFDTKNGKTVSLDKNLQVGVYQLVLKSKDAYGEPVEVKRIFRVWESSKPATRFTEPNSIVEKNSYEPGETARIWLGGKDQNLNVFFATEKETLQNPRWLRVNGAEQVSLPITEANRGGMFAHWFVVRNNRRYSSDLSITVPWSNKDLNITYESFRDKLAPGQQEEWRLKISGPKKDKVAAEMVATLYDASLDQFMMHQWTRIGFPGNRQQVFSNNVTGFNLQIGELRYEYTPEDIPVNERSYRALNWFDFPMYGGRMQFMYDMAAPAAAPMRSEGRAGGMLKKSRAMQEPEVEEQMKESSNSGNVDSSIVFDPGNPQQPKETPPPPALRTNLNETVFFMPEIRTDAEGNVVLKFKMNEALTRWKLITYAHTKDLKEAISIKEVVTQKDLMVQANAPRFLRAGDAFEFSAKVSNLSKEVIDGKASLTLLDAATLQPLDAQFGLDDTQKAANFNVQPGQSAPLRWNIKIPTDFSGAVTWQVFADGKQFRDGEESTIPVVTNRMLVTETLPITVRGGQTKKFSFDNLKNANSKTLVTQRYTLEFTSNPAWYVVQSLPYLMEYPHECSEQIFSRFYANTLAASVTAKMPNIRRVYERWKGTDAMKSPLSKNQELKYALLEETPWVMEAQSEEQQRQNIALLFDLNRMADERERALGILAERQTSNGAWPWFSGGMESWYITQYIVEGLGHLQHLGAFDLQKDQKADQMLDKALGFCDKAIEKQYEELEKLVQTGKAKWEDDHLDGMAIHYLYARSFFPLDKINKIHAYYLEQAQKYWLGKGLYQEGLIALALQRNGRKEAAMKIANSLRERAQQKEELGMYWAFDWGYYWYNLPIETQSLMVEVFDEVANDAKAVEELRIWLLKNKQTNRWESTKATAEAAYALLLHGENWLENTKQVSVSLGGRTIKPNEVEPGTGYFKQQWSGNDVKPSWSEVTVANPNSNIVWGAAYWQYFEDLDKIGTFKKTPLTIVKQLFREENSPTGPVLKPITDHAGLKVGDKLKVRIEIRVDRPMEYVHLKDMRAAGFEPVNVISGYRYQGGLGYYESTKDLATNFFIDYLPRGTYVFEYPMFVSHRGDMSNGITTMQCMYAPEFTTHSEGIRVKVE